MARVLNEHGPDQGVAWHYGDPLREQRWLEAGEASVDLSHRPVFSVSGPDRLTWLHALSSQALDTLPPGEWTSAYILNPQGHLEHGFAGFDDGDTFWAHTEPGRLDALLAWLGRMVFASQVEVTDRSLTHAVVLRGLQPQLVVREEVEAALGECRAGTWAVEALRVAAGSPRIFIDTDHTTLPNEIAMPDGDRLGDAVNLKKGCYRGQETVARVYNLGRPPRRLTLLHLDGSDNELPATGSAVFERETEVGMVGTVAVHYELGPIALALIKRTVDPRVVLVVDGIAASQEIVVDPDVGKHVRMVS